MKRRSFINTLAKAVPVLIVAPIIVSSFGKEKDDAKNWNLKWVKKIHQEYCNKIKTIREVSNVDDNSKVLYFEYHGVTYRYYKEIDETARKFYLHSV